MFRFNKNGTITTGMDLSCVTLTAAGAPVLMAPCDGKPHQVLKAVAAENSDMQMQRTALYTIENGGLCIDNSYAP
jgi:hypothetical protein